MTVYDPDPLHTVHQFERAGATHLHLVDLEGAKTGRTTNLPVIQRIAAQTNLLIEVGAASAPWIPSGATWRPGPAG